MLPPIHPDLRYHNHATLLRARLGGPAARIPVDAGFTCPNRDGTLGTGGCLYCNNTAFAPGVRFPGLPVEEQVRRTIASPGRHRHFRKVLVYFQPYSNTHAPPEALERTYRAALAHPDVAGIIVGTRPDCLPPAALDVLEGIARACYVSVEVGLQSFSDEVLSGMNRGHTVADFEAAVRALRLRGIDVGVHLIYGLPGDRPDDFPAAAERLSRLGVQAVKLHHFHVVRGSGLEAAWRRGTVPVPGYREYVAACADFIERLDPGIAVMRLVGEAPGDLLLAPRWTRGGREASRDVTAVLLARGSWQGSRRNGVRGGADR